MQTEQRDRDPRGLRFLDTICEVLKSAVEKGQLEAVALILMAIVATLAILTMKQEPASTQLLICVMACLAFMAVEVYVGAGVRLGPETVVGNSCRIDERGTARRCIIMEDCWIGAGREVDHCLIGAHCKIADEVRLAPFTVLEVYTVIGNDGWPNWAEEKEFQYA